MRTCYLMTAITFFLLILAAFQSIFNFPILKANHVTFMILTSIVYLFTETLIIFFFVGTGVSIKEYTQSHNLKPIFHQKSISIKRKVYPPLLMNMLYMMILFVIVGAVDTGRMAVWIYNVFFAFCIYHFLRVIVIQHKCFVENTDNILEMSGVKRTECFTSPK